MSKIRRENLKSNKNMHWALQNVTDKKLKHKSLDKTIGLFKTTQDAVSVKYKILFAIKLTLRGRSQTACSKLALSLL